MTKIKQTETKENVRKKEKKRKKEKMRKLMQNENAKTSKQR